MLLRIKGNLLDQDARTARAGAFAVADAGMRVMGHEP
jgi:hypothetical protein